MLIIINEIRYRCKKIFIHKIICYSENKQYVSRKKIDFTILTPSIILV